MGIIAAIAIVAILMFPLSESSKRSRIHREFFKARETLEITLPTKFNSFLEEEVLEKELVKADPFVSDFVPKEFTDFETPGLFRHHASRFHLGELGYEGGHRRVQRSPLEHLSELVRLQRRDVDSNSPDSGDVGKEIDPERQVQNIDKKEEESHSQRKLNITERVFDNPTLNEILDLIEEEDKEDDEEGENNETSIKAKKESSDETVNWMRNEINNLFSQVMSEEDKKLLLTLNETLSTSEKDKLFELTIAFMKISEKVSKHTTVGGAETTVVTADPIENSPTLKATTTTVENAQEKDICKSMELLKIHPQDSAEKVRRKYATIMKCYMDVRADPCEDFYQYACGRWTEYHPIPKDKSGYDTFEILREDLHNNLIKMFEEPLAETDSAAISQVKVLYNSCMDTGIIEKRREKPLIDLLKNLGGWPVLEGDNWSSRNFSWIDTITKLRLFNNDILVSIWIGPDGKDSNDFILQFDQSDLLLPSSDYYKLGFLHPIIQSYYNMLVKVATTLGAEEGRAKIEMRELIEFETKLSEIMVSPLMRRNFSEIYKKMPLEKLQEKVPDFNFSRYLDPILPRKLNETEEVVMYALPYFQKLTKLVNATDSRILANYILWRFIRHRINNLDQRFEVAQIDLIRLLYGREETPPRRKFCVSYVNGNLGNVVGSMYVQRHFDEQSKKDMEALTDEVQNVFRDLMRESVWLSNATKELADVKINNIVHNIGYPSDIISDERMTKEIEGLFYKKETFFENVLNNLRARTLLEMRQIDDIVNRTLWTTTPAVVNAYYSRNRNQIMFPAAILQPPFYHKHFPKALNYGGIGIVIGHEITHGFDDKGRQFDEFGNIKQWWDLSSFFNFKQRKQCMIDQYGNYLVEDVNIHLSGENTQGENIADNGGIKQAFYAYQNWLVDNNLVSEEALPGLENMNGEQLFFLNFAQVWCGHTRPEALRSKLKTAVHAPGPYRVLGTLSNSEEFSRAFRCSNSSQMNPETKCSVW